jgi:2,3-bisphosphoglycerate-dependent phosphoglycerate mutase
MREGVREHQVVFVRHGQSTWNKANRFIGWTDTSLTEDGEVEAREAGRVLVQNKIGKIFTMGLCSVYHQVR